MLDSRERFDVSSDLFERYRPASPARLAALFARHQTEGRVDLLSRALALWFRIAD